MSTLRAALVVVAVFLVPVAASALPAVQVVPAARLVAVADVTAQGLITDPDRQVVRAFALPGQTVPAGEIALATGRPIVNPTYIAVPVTITVDGKVARSIVAGYRVEQFVHTAVAARDLTAGAVLGEDDVTTARVLSNGRPAVDAAVLVGRRVRMAVARGASIFPEQTAVVELVKAGATTVLIVRDGPVALAADVVARSGGGLG